jgi:putative transposase
MIKAYEYRVYPTEEQETQFKKIIGLNRLYWNICLEEKKKDRSFKIEGYHQIFLKYKPEAIEWVKEVDSTPLAQAWSDIHQAFDNFFKSIKKQRKGKFVREPKFKSKKNKKDSLRFSSVSNPRFKDGKLWLTRKLGPIAGVFGCRFAQGKFKNVTFKRTATGKWFVKICVEKKDEPKCKNGKAIGVDWNCGDEDFLVWSDGTRTKCPRFLKKKQKQLEKHQRVQSKRYKKGAEEQSKNYEKSKFEVAKLHEKVSWQRKDWLHKLSREVANKYEFVVVEDINLTAMAQMHHGKVVGDQGFGAFRQMLSYKTTLIKVNPAYTSKTCHVCGSVNEKLTLADRSWTCGVCETHHDRDVNAAINILNRGVSTKGTMGTRKNVCGEPRSSMKQKSCDPPRQSNAWQDHGISPVFSG